MASAVLESSDANRAKIKSEMEALLHRLPSATGQSVSAPGFSRPTLAVLNKASEVAAELDDEYVSTEHLLVALASSEGTVGDLLRNVAGRCRRCWRCSPRCAARGDQ